MIPRRLFRLFYLSAFCLLTFLPVHIWAATDTVTDTSDSGTGSLRTVLASAASGDIIVFASGVSGTITLQSDLQITHAVTIQGPGAGTLAVSGGGSGSDFPVFELSATTGTTSISGLTIENGNSTSSVNFGEGGGVSMDNNTALSVAGCVFTGNSAMAGGGICLTLNGTLTLMNCAFTGNNAPGSSSQDGNGGGVYSSSGTVNAVNCSFSNNTAGQTGATPAAGIGGGIENDVGQSTLTGCTFTGNSATFDGGGFDSGASTLTNCVFVGNSAGYGGGIEDVLLSITLVNCTFTGNTATESMGGGALDAGGTTTLVNDILYGDTGGEVHNSDAAVTASHCDINEALGGSGDGVTDGGGNINQNPLFAGASADGHLQSGSPALGHGATQSEAPSGVTLPTADLDGFARPASPSIGAFEAPQADLTVTSANDADNGSLNVNGPDSTTLREAVRYANDYVGISITFDPTVFAAPQTITETLGELLLSAPMTVTGPAAGVAVSGNNANTVLEISGGTSSSPMVLSGLTIEDGTNFGAINLGSGGGIAVDFSGVVSLTDCAVIGNDAPNGGGGGLYNDDGTVALTDCALIDNQGIHGGGGMDNAGGTATLTNCVVSGNLSVYDGGGIANDGAITLTGCTVAGNTSDGSGGGMIAYNGPNTLVNDIFYDDTGGEITPYSAPVTASYCDIGEAIGPTSSGGDGVTDNGHNINADPLFARDPQTNSATDPGDLRLQSGSPCLGKGATQAEAPSGVTIPIMDITGAQRPSPPSIGAYDANAGSGGPNTTGPPTVGTALTTTTLTSSANPSMAGQSVNFTATVAPAPVGEARGDAPHAAPMPTGTVSFYLNGSATAFDTQALTSGQATSTAQTFAAGTYTITATYSGDSTYASSTAPLTQTVNAASTMLAATMITLTNGTDTTAPTVGQLIDLVARIAPSSATGTVTFTLTPQTGSAITSPAETLTNGGTNYTTSSLAAGTYTVTAAYNGDSSNAASTSNTLTLTISTTSTGTGTTTTTTPTVIHTFQPGLQMATLDETYSDFAAALNGAPPPAYDTYNGSNYVLTQSIATEAAPAPGTGFWIDPSSAVSIYNTGTSVTTATLALTQGWNLIGDPFTTAFPLASISITGSGQTAMGLSAANAAALLYGTLYTFPAGATTYTAINGTVSGASLSPFTGYWFYAFQSDEIVTMTQAD